MAAHPTPSTQLTLSPQSRIGEVHVELAAFVKFDNEMNHQLGQLVDRYAHLSSPRASVLGRRNRWR